MKKALAIFGITLGSLLVLVLIAIVTVMYMVFTPKRLTPIVNQVADKVLTCEHGLDAVELTFFSTFPNFGVAVRGLYVINPMEGAPSDTVLAVPELVVSVDLKKAIKGDIFVRHFSLNEVEANLYIAADGKTNFDVLRLPESSPKDTTDTVPGWQLRSLGWEDALRVSARKLCFVDEPDTISASLNNLQLTIGELYRDNCQGAKIDLTARQIACALKGVQYADGVNLNLTLPVLLADGTERVVIDGTQVSVNEFEIQLDGTVGTPCLSSGIYTCDLNLKTNDWQISSVLALLPEQYRSLVPKEVEADGVVALQAHAFGQYDSLSKPIVDAAIQLKEAQGRYTQLPYFADEIAAEVTAHVDLNEKSKTTAIVKRLYAHTGKSSVTLQGSATQIFKEGEAIELGNPLCDMTAKVKMDLMDADYFLRSDSCTNRIEGLVTGQVQVKTRLNDVTEGRYHKVQVKTDLALPALDIIWQDSLLAQVKDLQLHLTTPKKEAVHKQWLTADCGLSFSALHAQMLNMDLDAQMDGGTLQADIEWHSADTTVIPIINGKFELGKLNATMDTILFYALAPKGGVAVQPFKRDPSRPRSTIQFASQAMRAQMGEGLKIQTDYIDVEATSIYDRNAENVLLKWNPLLKFDLVNGHAQLAQVGLPKLSIPQIKFKYSNRNFQIDTSRIVLGNSDFSLGGEVRNVGKWLKHEGELVGELRFTSDKTDVNELLAIVNNLNESADTTQQEVSTVAEPTAVADNTPSGPFMVPLQVDLALNTRIRKAYVFDEVLENLGGRLYIKDGKLILEEMGFICEAAKMQLTAIYQTPRRNHIYTGLDFHLLDIDIQNLIRMIPEIDSAVPMLKSFQGNAEFHIALETYLNDKYQPKVSTQRGACSIEGSDLVLLDSETFNKISKILLFSPKTENLIDSISVQLALYKDQVTVYPFCLSIDNYMVALGGNHYLDMNFNYHASLLKPFYIGVDVKGNLDDLSIKPAKCRYAQDFRPLFHKDVESQSAELRSIISTSLKKSVKTQ